MRMAIYNLDDEVKELHNFIDLYSKQRKLNIEVEEYTSCEEFLEKYEIGRYTIIFLYVEDLDSDGMVIADKIRKIPDYSVIIIFVSKSSACMELSFDVRAAQFLLKPLEYETFKHKMDVLFEYIIESRDRIISFDSCGVRYVMNMSEIYSIESEQLKGSNSNIKVVLKDKELHIKGVLKNLLMKYNENLIAINRYALINKRQIFKFDGNEIELKNGIKLMVSRRRIKEVKSMLDRLI